MLRTLRPLFFIYKILVLKIIFGPKSYPDFPDMGPSSWACVTQQINRSLSEKKEEKKTPLRLGSRYHTVSDMFW